MTEPADFLRQPDVESDSWARVIARELMKNAADADDIVQDLWLDVLEKSPESVRSPRAWIRGALRNRFLMAKRSASRRRAHEAKVASSDGGIEDTARRSEATDLVRWALGKVRAPYREVLEMRYLADLEVDEIADRLKSEPGTIRKRLSRGIEQMRAALDEKMGRGSSGWPAILLPLALGRSPSSSEASGRMAIVLPSARRRNEKGFRLRMAAAIMTASAVVFWLLLPSMNRRLAETTPSQSRTTVGSEELRDVLRPRKNDETAAATTEDATVPPPGGPPTEASPSPSSEHRITMTIRLIEDGKGIEVPILVEAMRIGPFAIAMRARRPMSTYPEASTPFRPLASLRTLSGQPFSIPVPSNGFYRLRISNEVAANVCYVSTAPGFDAELEILVSRNIRIKILGLSDVADVVVVRDDADPTVGTKMAFADDDDDDVRRADGPFLFPILINAEIGSGSEMATTFINHPRSTIVLPAMSKALCAVRSARDDAPIPNPRARSALALKDGTTWSIYRSGDSRGIVEVFGPKSVEDVLTHFTQLTAEGFVSQKIGEPLSLKFLRDQQLGQAKDDPIVVRLARTEDRPSGRILDAFGVPVRRGSVYPSSNGRFFHVGVVGDDGRFFFEPVVDTVIFANPKSEYRAVHLDEGETTSLIYDDDETGVMRFLDVKTSELERGEWIGRLPARKSEALRFVDRVTRAPLTPSKVLLLPIGFDGKAFGSPLFEGFEGRRWPLGGVWLLTAESTDFEPITTTIDFDHDLHEIEMTPRSVRLLRVTFRKPDGPLAGYPVELSAMDGRKLSDSAFLTSSDGEIEIHGDSDQGRCRYRLVGGEYDASIHSPLVLEVGKNQVIDAVPVRTVNIRAVEPDGSKVSRIGVLVRRPNGELGRDAIIPCNGEKVTLTAEPQIIYVVAPDHRPAAVSWAPGVDAGSVEIDVTLERGYKLEFVAVKPEGSQDPYICSIGLLEPFDVGATPVPTIDWQTNFERDPLNRSHLSATLAPGRYLLQFEYRGEVKWSKVFEIRGDIDLGDIVIPK